MQVVTIRYTCRWRGTWEVTVGGRPAARAVNARAAVNLALSHWRRWPDATLVLPPRQLLAQQTWHALGLRLPPARRQKGSQAAPQRSITSLKPVARPSRKPARGRKGRRRRQGAASKPPTKCLKLR
jgi:hypothetical protein